jgi:hypothetical protein
MAGSSSNGEANNDTEGAVDVWAIWRTLSLGRRFSARLVGGLAAAGTMCALDIWVFNEDSWSLGWMGFTAALLAVIFPISFWLSALRRSAG